MFPQTRLGCEIREHLVKLSGVAVTDAIDAPIAGSWIEFTFRGHLFTINEEYEEFVFYVEDGDCPGAVLSEVAGHFNSFFSGRTDPGDNGDITLRRL